MLSHEVVMISKKDTQLLFDWQLHVPTTVLQIKHDSSTLRPCHGIPVVLSDVVYKDINGGIHIFL